MQRIIIIFALAILTFPSSVAACDGQKGKVIYEDKFADDAGGWAFDTILQSKPPVAEMVLPVDPEAYSYTYLNKTFTAAEGDYCVEASFPPNAAKVETSLGVVFLATDLRNGYAAVIFQDGFVVLNRTTGGAVSSVWSVQKPNLVNVDPAAKNEIRALVRDGKITVFVNGQEIKTVRAPMPQSEMQFGFKASNQNPSTEPHTAIIRSFQLTAGQ